MKRIAVVTTTRAEYGLLTPLIRRIANDEEFTLMLLVTGAHLVKSQGYTIKEIEADGFPIADRIPILDEDNTPYGASLTMANAIRGFAECFRKDRPDLLVILGDRTEMLGIASAAMNERIPIAHIAGGEITAGAVDDSVRHALTKMSYLHFTSTDEYRSRVIRLGENPARVFNVGALGAENILREKLLEEPQIRVNIGIPERMKYALVTFHPVTLEENSAENQAKVLCDVMSQNRDIFFVITGSNTDAGGDMVNLLLETYAVQNENACFVSSLGMKRYLSAVKYAAFVMGNSSSGILEAPVLGTPTINIGDRQKGRIQAKTILNCEPEEKAIRDAIQNATTMRHEATNIYGAGNTSELMVQIMKELLLNDSIDLKKGFYEE